MTNERPLYYDKEGDPLDHEVWARRFEDMAYRRVGWDEVGDVIVSTVWLGLDHGFAGTGPPLIFETMIIKGDDYSRCRRYATIEQAREGHAEAVRLVRLGLEPEEAANG